MQTDLYHMEMNRNQWMPLTIEKMHDDDGLQNGKL